MYQSEYIGYSLLQKPLQHKAHYVLFLTKTVIIGQSWRHSAKLYDDNTWHVCFFFSWSWIKWRKTGRYWKILILCWGSSPICQSHQVGVQVDPSIHHGTQHGMYSTYQHVKTKQKKCEYIYALSCIPCRVPTCILQSLHVFAVIYASTPSELVRVSQIRGREVQPVPATHQ